MKPGDEIWPLNCWKDSRLLVVVVSFHERVTDVRDKCLSFLNIGIVFSDDHLSNYMLPGLRCLLNDIESLGLPDKVSLSCPSWPCRLMIHYCLQDVVSNLITEHQSKIEGRPSQRFVGVTVVTVCVLKSANIVVMKGRVLMVVVSSEG